MSRWQYGHSPRPAPDGGWPLQLPPVSDGAGGKTLSQRNAVIDALAQQGIASNVHYKPLPLLTAYRDLGFRMEDYPNAYGLYERELTRRCIPH